MCSISDETEALHANRSKSLGVEKFLDLQM